MMQKIIDLDAFDRHLIELVRQDNVQPAREMAEQVGLSVSAVLRRLRRLREAQIIVADVAVIHPALTGSALTMHVLVKAKDTGLKAVDAFIDEISRHAEITGAWYVTGDEDFLLKVQVATMEEFDAFTRRVLQEESGVKTYKTLITIKTIVEDGPSSRPLRMAGA